jgi:hypothetical protein
VEFDGEGWPALSGTIADIVLLYQVFFLYIDLQLPKGPMKRHDPPACRAKSISYVTPSVNASKALPALILSR